MKRGLWKEKCEAANSLFYLYQTFQQDFKDPPKTILLPLLEIALDESSKVRAHICTIIGNFQMFIPEAIYSLICRLQDKEEEVRQVAQVFSVLIG